jgi:hypothetical protein
MTLTVLAYRASSTVRIFATMPCTPGRHEAVTRSPSPLGDGRSARHGPRHRQGATEDRGVHEDRVSPGWLRRGAAAAGAVRWTVPAITPGRAAGGADTTTATDGTGAAQGTTRAR